MKISQPLNYEWVIARRFFLVFLFTLLVYVCLETRGGALCSSLKFYFQWRMFIGKSSNFVIDFIGKSTVFNESSRSSSLLLFYCHRFSFLLAFK